MAPADAARGAVSGEGGKSAAFVGVCHEIGDDYGPGLGIAVANERGYNPVPLTLYRAATLDEAMNAAERLNRDLLKIDHETEFRIVGSTMGGRRFHEEAGA